MKTLGFTLILGTTLALIQATNTLAINSETITFRQDRQVANTKNQIKVEGALTCDLGTNNIGQSCLLEIKESKTGKAYHLVNAREAMRLYMSGNKNVAIEGTLAGEQTIDVSKAMAL